MRSFKSKFPSSLFLALLFNTLNLLAFRVISLYSLFINAVCRARCKRVNLCVRNIYHVQLYNLIVCYCFVQDTCGRIFNYYVQQYKSYIPTRGRTALYVGKTWRPTLCGSPRDDRALWEPSSPFHTKLEQSHLMIMMIWCDDYIYTMMILYDILMKIDNDMMMRTFSNKTCQPILTHARLWRAFLRI